LSAPVHAAWGDVDGTEKLDVGAKNGAGEVVFRSRLISRQENLKPRLGSGGKILLPGTGLLRERLGTLFRGKSEHRSARRTREALDVRVEVTGKRGLAVLSLEIGRDSPLNAVEAGGEEEGFLGRRSVAGQELRSRRAALEL
jgi:hypothetical protein